MTATVSIDRTSLSLSPLVINGFGVVASPTYLLTSLGRPAITARTTYMPDSPDIHGSELVSVAKDQSSLPINVLVQSDSAANLDAAVAALTDALWQFSYATTVTIDGVAKTWACDPAAYAPTSGVEDANMWAQHFDQLTITIPVYPIPGST